MASSATSVLTAIFMAYAMPAMAAATLSVDADVRAMVEEDDFFDVRFHRLAAGLRKSFMDSRGDRLALYGLIEAEDNFTDWSLHELYAKYKGPMGRYNLTAGRFTLPYGLLSSMDPTRFLYETHSMKSVGLHVDNGLSLTGVLGNYDYAAAITQGYGGHHKPGFPGHGLITMRVGMALSGTDEYQLGLSGVFGRVARHNNRQNTVSRALGALDATLYLGPLLFRGEWNAGRLASSLFFSSFTGLEYPLSPKLDVILTSLNSRHLGGFDNHVFIGASCRLRWLTLRGGYRYAFQSHKRHRLSFQIYRLYTHTP
jgi:hypothetical protein